MERLDARYAGTSVFGPYSSTKGRWADRTMMDALLNKVRALAAPPPFIAWLSTQPSPVAAWHSCPDPEWLLCLARAHGIAKSDAVRAVASIVPRARDVAGDSRFGDIVELASRLIDAYAHGSITDELARQASTTLKPRIIDWNIHNQFPRGQVPAGIPAPPPRELYPLVGAATAALRIHEEARDPEWVWRSRLVLVLRWCVFEASRDGRLPPFSLADVAENARRETLERPRVAEALRSKLHIGE